MNKRTPALLLVFSTTWCAMSWAENTPKVDSAIELIKIGCVTGNSANIEVTGDGNVSFLKKGVSGAVQFTSEEINGVIKGANQSLRAAENSEIRTCMQQYIPKILDAILEVRATKPPSEDDNYYLSNQQRAMAKSGV